MSAPKQETNGPYRVPAEPNRWPSIGLAVGVHALLLAFLYIGVSWQTNSPVQVEAEVWDLKTETAAPPPPPPAPEPEPEPEPETPPPEPTPRAVEPPPPPPVAKPEPKAPDIALEQKKRKEAELKRKQEQAEEERQEREREIAEQKRADEKKAKALADKKERELAEKKERELAEKAAEKKAADKKAQELAKKEEAEKKKADKEKAEKLAKAKAEKAEAAQLAKLASMTRDAETKRLTGSGNPGSTGSAEKSTAPRLDAGYLGKIAAVIKSNANYAGSTDVPGNPTVSFIVTQLPTGDIVSVKKVKSSGIPEFDDAVERSINKSSPLPKKKDGTVEKTLPVNFHMKDLN